MGGMTLGPQDPLEMFIKSTVARIFNAGLSIKSTVAHGFNSGLSIKSTAAHGFNAGLFMSDCLCGRPRFGVTVDVDRSKLVHQHTTTTIC